MCHVPVTILFANKTLRGSILQYGQRAKYAGKMDCRKLQTKKKEEEATFNGFQFTAAAATYVHFCVR